MAITYFGVASALADNANPSTQNNGVYVITPPASMLAGDLCVMIGQVRSTDAALQIMAPAGGDGQAWTEETIQSGTTVSTQLFWCTFNGTWDNNPALYVRPQGRGGLMSGCGRSLGDTTLPTTAILVVFRPTSTSNTWAIDVAKASGTFAAPTTPFTVTRKGVTTVANNVVALAVWGSGDDNSWGSINTFLSTGTAPYGITYDPTQNQFCVCNLSSNTVSFIDASTNTIIGSPLTVGTAPYGVAYDVTQNQFCVTNQNSDTVSFIDASTNTIIGSALAVGAVPRGVAYDVTQNQFCVCNFNANTVNFIDASTRAIIGSALSVGTNPDGVAYDVTQNQFCVTNRNANTVSFINASTRAIIGSALSVGTNPIGVAYDVTQNQFCVCNDGSDTVNFISASSRVVIGSALSVGDGPRGVAYDVTQNQFCVCNFNADTVNFIDASTRAIIGSALSVGDEPIYITYDATQDQFCLSNITRNSVTFIDATNRTLITFSGWVQVGTQWRNLASSDMSTAIAYQIVATGGTATRDASLNQSVVTGDAGNTTIIAFKEV